MVLTKWYVGLEIRPSYFCAVALRYAKRQWHLCGYWHISLITDAFDQQGLILSKTLISQLLAWRSQLPTRISLRCVLPDLLILQRHMLLPKVTLSEYQLTQYLNTQLPLLLPLPIKELAIDYRRYHDRDQSWLIVTAIRKHELAQWQYLFSRTHLVPEILEIAPTLLRQLAHQCAVPHDYLLLHKQEQTLLITAPLNAAFYFQTLSIADIPPQNYKTLAIDTYATAQPFPVNNVIFTEEILQPHSDAITHWPSLSDVTHSTPNYSNNSLFILPYGLALRERDHATNQSITLA